MVGGGYAAHVEAYNQAGAHMFSYEELQTQPEQELANLAEFLGAEVTKERISEIVELSRCGQRALQPLQQRVKATKAATQAAKEAAKEAQC